MNSQGIASQKIKSPKEKLMPSRCTITRGVIKSWITKNQVTKGKTDTLKSLRKHLLEELEQTFPDEVESYREIRAVSTAVSYIYDFVGWISQQCKYLSMRFIMVGNNNP
uniref:Mediator of RNA polymerase II transcription subunit 10 n=1 Tax=Populus trichocarpa TaxID=3694 RepID=A0A3N7G8T1_POPTR